MARTPQQLSPAGLEFLAERHLASLTTLRADGTPHVVAVGFTWDADTATARVITSRASQKVRNAARGGPGVLFQVDGPRWLALEGTTRVTDDPAQVVDAVARYAVRYRQPRVNPERVAIVLDVTRVLGSASLF